MSKNTDTQPKKSTGLAPVLCNIAGTLILLLVIATALPLSIPRLKGYEIYNVVSPSMTPAVPMGSVVYILPAEPTEIQPGDVIAFNSNGTVVTHRVVQNRVVEGNFVTKGDMNEDNDPEPVSYGALIGRMEFHIPYVGNFLSVYSSSVGKLYIYLMAASGLMLNVLAGRLRDRRREEGYY